MQTKDYYKILDISENASAEEIKKAYRKLALKYHPDKTKGDKKKEEKFKEVNEAYNILKDKTKREEYDNFRKYGAQGYCRDIDFNDFSKNVKVDVSDFNIEDLFSEIFRNKRARHSYIDADEYSYYYKQPYQDNLDKKILLNIKEKDMGKGKKLKVKRRIKCGNCSGKGYIFNGNICQACNGTGEIEKIQIVKFKIPLFNEKEKILKLANLGRFGVDGRVGNLYIKLRK